MRTLNPVVFINHLSELQAIKVTEGGVTFGAGVTYTKAFEVLATKVPALAALINRIGGEQVRNMGTIGGNIANGSPIGDSPPPLIALGATLKLRSASGTRMLRLEDYFIGYLNHPYLSVYTGRGCKSRCTFCLWPQTIGGHVYRTRSVEHVVAEIAKAKE